ncbi:MAG: GtrA family protein [Cytophagales bacterium]|nr:GtrA family protein [Cytophagales bacterium]
MQLDSFRLHLSLFYLNTYKSAYPKNFQTPNFYLYFTAKKLLVEGEFKERIIRLVKQGIKYGVVGILNVTIYLLFFELFTRVFNIHYLTSNIIASVISFLNSLYFNRRWTFKSESSFKRDSVYFSAIFLFCLSVQSGALYLLVENLKFDPQLAKYVGIVIFASLNFSLNKFITFRTKPAQA